MKAEEQAQYSVSFWRKHYYQLFRQQMSFIYTRDRQGIGQLISIIGLSLAPLSTLISKHYSRTLFFTQLVYLTSIYMIQTHQNIISRHFHFTWLDCMGQFTCHFSQFNDFACLYGRLVSSAIVWMVGAIVLSIMASVSNGLRLSYWLNIYNFYKGLFYWFMPPLVFYTIDQIISPTIDEATSITNSIAAVFILVITIATFIASYFVDRAADNNKGYRELQFLTHWVVFFNVTAVTVYINVQSYRQAMRYAIPNLFLGMLFIAQMIVYEVKFKVTERILVVLADGLIIATLNIIAFKPQYIYQQHLDFWLVVTVGILEIAEILLKLLFMYKKRTFSKFFHSLQAILPQNTAKPLISSNAPPEPSSAFQFNKLQDGSPRQGDRQSTSII